MDTLKTALCEMSHGIKELAMAFYCLLGLAVLTLALPVFVIATIVVQAFRREA